MGFFRSLVSGRRRSDRTARLAAPAPPAKTTPLPVQFADVFRDAHAEFDQASAAAVSAAVRAADAAPRALLALAFANPFVYRPAASMSSDTLVLLVIDTSFSMRAGTRLDDARREAMSVLASRQSSERVQVMALDSQLHTLTQPTQDSATQRAALGAIQPGDSRASFAELARAVRLTADNVRTPIELHLFSDMQRSDMAPSLAEMVLPDTVTLVLHPVARARSGTGPLKASPPQASFGARLKENRQESRRSSPATERRLPAEPSRCW